ncbi:helix-turn-helix domain-containing protein [Listeria booriae]|uniref:helix-turn-helix domain-containing protein n=1 Tax=Listeria booriae TaxID=1552123 RepID=UPI00162A0228|nr:helix-turn-helix domain-containing protein [Listeria booriae]MBC1228418.1 helix-turn-helix domain-containing protein [Listeria booriae]MBC2366760.1 helix-turn-helix domain-containing protein [Listeria booriae]
MKKKFIVPTGYIIKEYLAEYGITQKELSARIDMSQKHISNLLNGNSRLTEDVAVKLEKIFREIPASYWLNYESEYREYLTREKHSLLISESELQALSERFNFNEIFKGLNWSLQKQAEEMLGLLQISTFNKFDEVYSSLNINFMKDGGQIEPIAVWLNLCREEVDIQNIDLTNIPYDKELLLSKLKILKSIANNPNIDNSINSARKLLNSCGINLVHCDAITNSKVRGALTSYKNKPAIYLSYRFQTHDHIWFALMHEIGHLILHYESQQTILTYEVGMDNPLTIKESDANKFSRNFFISDETYADFISLQNFSEKSIIDLAYSQRIQPGILVARLQHDKLISYDQLNYLKQR